MIGGLRGRLVSVSFAQDEWHTLPRAERPPGDVVRQLEQWGTRRDRGFGPTSSARAIADGLVVPLLSLLGLQVLRRVDAGSDVRLTALANGTPIPFVVCAWSDDLGRAWRGLVLDGIAADARWCVCANGCSLRVLDSHRTWSRDHLEFDLEVLPHDHELQGIFWSLLRSEALAGQTPFLDEVVDRSARHGSEICRTLGDGVLGSLQMLLAAIAQKGRQPPARLFEQSLTIVYRILFLLFAEARALVPIWHPIYRDRYTIDAIVSTLIAGRRYRGAWSAIQAISRIAHAGCSVGELNVTAFNGRLFAPAHAPDFEQQRLADDVVAKAVLAMSTTRARHGVVRIRYRDLDVEQLGAVYERLLEYEPSGPSAALTRNRDTRKATGTFYTPRQVTAYLVRQTLAPLIADRTADEILGLRIVDPAMGSGAFLVGACRFLAHATEDALVREGRWHAGDVTGADRASLRREIAQRCLYGVDLNPVAVQLARLSLWLATLAADKPLTFLDHHLAAGNSLVGATFDDLARQPGGGGRRGSRPATLPLFEAADVEASLQPAIRGRLALARLPDDSAAIVRDKERQLATIHDAAGPLGRWASVMTLWCAGWFLPRGLGLDRTLSGELTRSLLTGRCALPASTVSRLLGHVEAAADTHRFFHWPVAFPEVFHPNEGNLAPPGFDAVIGNPPWDMVRGDSGEAGVREGRRDDARHVAAFVREAGVYKVDARSHVNRYALFLERALQLVRPGGRIGLVLPSGVLSDVGTAPLRRYLFDRAAVDSVVGLDNHAGIFPIHRSVRFVLLTCSTGTKTEAVGCRFGLSQAEDLEKPAAEGSRLTLTRAFLARVSGPDDMGVPELLSVRDLRIVERVAACVPSVADQDGWHLRFGRELNASDDRALFEPFADGSGARPVLEGKQIEPFQAFEGRSRFQLKADAASRVPRRARLAYRDVASATNRLTLIAAIVPARAVTTHTLFCLKTPLPSDAQHVVCGLLNSFVANYLIRLRVSTHVTAALIARLRLPLVTEGSPAFTRLATLARTLAAAGTPAERSPEYAELQALVARLYGLTADDFEHILGTFPLIPIEIRNAALTDFNSLH